MLVESLYYAKPSLIRVLTEDFGVMGTIICVCRLRSVPPGPPSMDNGSYDTEMLLLKTKVRFCIVK